MLFRFFLSILVVFFYCAGNAYAADQNKQLLIDTIQTQLEAVPKSIENKTEREDALRLLKDLRDNAQLIIDSKTQELSGIDIKLKNLGEAPKEASEAPASPESQDIENQRKSLQQEYERLDANIKLARLIINDSQQRTLKLLAESRLQFRAALFERVNSPLTYTFWQNFTKAWPADATRIQKFSSSVGDIFTKALKPENKNFFYAGIAGALFILVFINRLLQNILRLVAIEKIPTGRARRSVVATGLVLNNVLITGLSLYIFYTGLNWNKIVRPELHVYFTELIYIFMFGALISGLGKALLSQQHESWRLPKLSNNLVKKLQFFPLLIAFIAVAFQTFRISSNPTGLSLDTEVSGQVISNVIMALIGFMILVIIKRHYQSESAQEPTGQGQPKTGLKPIILRGFCWFIIIASLVFTLIGFVALGAFLIMQLLWTVIVLACFYILFKLCEDFFHAIIASQGIIGSRLVSRYQLSANFLNQLDVIFSAISKILLVYLLIVILLAPYGTSLGELFNQSGKFESFMASWESFITPQIFFTVVFIVFAGYQITRILKSWLTVKYFPNTDIETGVRSSIVTVLGYIGAIITIMLTLSTLGISFEKLTWIVSALSVGIGFGLQAIVQNFISGLIMLVERPVKVGDWVVLGTQEGDIRRINVRATEIQLGDRSTLIVPNSEFITKAVRNMTHIKGEGRVQIRLPLPLNVNPVKVRDMISEIFLSNDNVLKGSEVEPYIRLEGIEAGNLMLLATCFVASPRITGRIKSELLFEIIEKLHIENIPLSQPVLIEKTEPVISAN